MLSVFSPGSPGSCSASSSVSATSTSPKEDSSCLEESKFLAPAPYASPSPFPFLDSSRILTTSPGSPLFQPHQVPQKKAHPGWINPKFWLQPRMLPLLFVCFQNHLALDLLHVFRLGFFSVSSLFTTPSAGGPFAAISWHDLASDLGLDLKRPGWHQRNPFTGIVSNAQILQWFLCIGTMWLGFALNC